MMKKLIVPIFTAGSLNAAAFVVDGNVAAAVGALVATVIITLTVVKWIDDRISHKIKNYAQVVKWQHRTILQEISNLRELQGHSPLDVDSILAVEEEKETG